MKQSLGHLLIQYCLKVRKRSQNRSTFSSNVLFPPISSNLISNQSKLWYARIGVCPSQEEEHSKLKESNRQLVAVAKGLAGALLVVGVGPILTIISKHRKHCFQVKCLSGKCRASMISDIWNQEKTFRVLLLRQNYGMVGEQEAWQHTLSVSTLSPGKNWFKEFLEDPPCDTHVKLTPLFVF